MVESLHALASGYTACTRDGAGVVVAFARVDDPAAEYAPQLVVTLERPRVDGQQRRLGWLGAGGCRVWRRPPRHLQLTTSTSESQRRRPMRTPS